jgi:hypothetical protein
VQGFAGVCAARAKACSLRSPTTSNLYGYKPSVQIERGFWGKPDAWPRSNQFRNNENGLPQDRLRFTDGFIIRGPKTIRTDGLSSVQGFAGICAARARACALHAPTTSNLYGCKPSVQIERGFWVNRISFSLTALKWFLK